MDSVTKDLLEALQWAVENPNDDAYWIERARSAIARAEAALTEPKPAADGWIPWAGGECPVGPDAWVEAKLRDGKAWIGKEAQRGEEWLWDHEGGSDDIIAYRVVEAQP